MDEADKAALRAWSAVVARGGDGTATELAAEMGRRGVVVDVTEAMRRLYRLRQMRALP